MKPYPHVYCVTARGTGQGTVAVAAPELPGLETAPPPEFDGPPGHWSPETLLAAAVADCFVLTFRGVARAAGFEWQRLDCDVEGTLERVDGVTRFSRFATRATLAVAPGADEEKARRLLERAEAACLVSNSLKAERSLEARVVAAPA
jgi:organic hydroperoxide reductase OsmC/OhrA